MNRGKADALFERYGRHHRNPMNKAVHNAIERSRPSFIEDLRSFLIGPAWLLGFVYRRLGLPPC